MEDMAKKANDAFDAFMWDDHHHPTGLKRFYDFDDETRANVRSTFMMIYPSLNEDADTDRVIAEIASCVYMARKRIAVKALGALLEATR